MLRAPFFCRHRARPKVARWGAVAGRWTPCRSGVHMVRRRSPARASQFGLAARRDRSEKPSPLVRWPRLPRFAPARSVRPRTIHVYFLRYSKSTHVPRCPPEHFSGSVAEDALEGAPVGDEPPDGARADGTETAAIDGASASSSSDVAKYTGKKRAFESRKGQRMSHRVALALFMWVAALFSLALRIGFSGTDYSYRAVCTAHDAMPAWEAVLYGVLIISHNNIVSEARLCRRRSPARVLS